jgi:hypothetical protein
MGAGRPRFAGFGRRLFLGNKGKRQSNPGAVRSLPIVAGLPHGSVWFLRLALAFLDHLARGGHVMDQLTRSVMGDPSGPPFNFNHVRGGPLFWLPGLVDTNYLFVGHTVCPGFARISDRFPSWREVGFVMPGYDYLHEGLDYARTPVDLAPHPYAALDVDIIERDAWTSPKHRAALVHCDPIEQAAQQYLRARGHLLPVHHRLDGKRLAEWSFRDYLLERALPSYAKYILPFQAMAAAMPGSVQLFSLADLRRQPAQILGAIVSQVTGKAPCHRHVAQAAALARREHLFHVQVALGHSFDRAQRLEPGQVDDEDLRSEPLYRRVCPSLRTEVRERLDGLGVDSRCLFDGDERATGVKLQSPA